VDKWLWHARFFKTRTLAAKQVSEGKIRVNSTKISKPSRLVQPGDVLTFAKADHVRVIKVVAAGARRGPAPEAQSLYLDLDPPAKNADPEKTTSRQVRKTDNNLPVSPKNDRKGRPTKKERRNLRLSKGPLLE